VSDTPPRNPMRIREGALSADRAPERPPAEARLVPLMEMKQNGCTCSAQGAQPHDEATCRLAVPDREPEWRDPGVPDWTTCAGITNSSGRILPAADGTWVTPDHLCPDLLRYENIGGADGLRGRVVRAFFWLMRAWPV